MPAKQLAAIQPIAHQIVMAPEEQNWCATFEADGSSELWLQLLNGSVNAAYPYDDDPLVRLERAGLAAEVQEVIAFEAGAYATLILKDVSVTSLAKFVDAWFSRILAVGDDYAVDAKLEDLG